MILAWLDFCPPGHEDHIIIKKNLAVSLSQRYMWMGDVSDLNRSMELMQARLDLCPLGHPQHANAVEDLVLSVWDYYNVQKNKEHLKKLKEMAEKWVELCPWDHPSHARALGVLALSLSNSYVTWGDITDLNRAIKLQKKKLDLCPPDHPSHGAALGNLAVSIYRRYQSQGNLSDLNRAIDLEEKRLKLYSPNHPKYGEALGNHAMSLKRRYIKMKNHSDLIKVIKLHKEALNFYPVQHPNYASNVHSLAAAILLSFKSPQSSHPPDQPLLLLHEAFQTYKLLKTCTPAVSLTMWKATRAWVQDAEKHNHPSVMEAYHISISTLDHFTSFNSSLNSRHKTMQGRATNLANNAFSCAIRHNEFQMATELLEQGRGVLWNQLACFDISMATLESQSTQGCELGRKFAQLSVDLREHAQGSGGQRMDPYWRIWEEWQGVVDKIRSIDGFSRFLLPPHFEDLQRAAEHGPVIIVNASKYTCDTLIVLHTRAPIHVPLPCSLADVDQLCEQLSELTRDSHAYGQHRELYMKGILRELWSSVVERITFVLQNDVQLLPGSRIWWCPLSKFTALPLHAAGPYRKAQKNFMDLYVSSYAPSLSGLIRTRGRVRAQREAHNRTANANQISFAAVSQARPSADIKLGELVEVEHEIWRIRNGTGMPPGVTFETVTGDAATIEGAVQAFRNHRWVHVACHGAQHASKPFDSWFAMGDGKLTLMRIIRERYTNSEFAFLSACHTAVGDKSTPDEVLHLAAGMQFAGFNGVIGTLWRVDDAVAHRFVTRFYQEMFKHETIDFEHAAAALNTTAVETADEVSLEKRIVFVHIGI